MNSHRPLSGARSARPALVFLLLAASLALACTTRPARADVSSWVFLGGGTSVLKQQSLSARATPDFRLHFGLGSDPSHPVIVGGLFSWEPHFGYGSDLALMVRGASRSFVNGGFGLALDLGPYERFWGQRSVGGAGTLWLGAPWGIGLGLGGSVGSHDASDFSATLGIDFARLTVYRNSGTSWFSNPFPAYRPKDPAAN